MRQFFHRHLNQFKMEVNYQAYPKVQISHLVPHGRSTLMGYVLINNNLKSQFFTAGRTAAGLTVLMTSLFDRSFRGCYITLFLNSLNYFAKRPYLRKLRFDLHFSKKITVPLPPSVIVRIMKKRLCFFGLPENVIPFVHLLIHLRPYDSYTGYGVRIPFREQKENQVK